MRAINVIFKITTLRKSPIGRKFAQSGYPGSPEKYQWFTFGKNFNVFSFTCPFFWQQQLYLNIVAKI
jgi:hypothetical protein